jgi:hypothetical protein
VSRPDVLACAHWLQSRLGAFVFAVDHPGLPRCAGAHRPGQPCDGTRGKHPACSHWSQDSAADPDVIAAALSRGLRNLGVDCGRSGLLVVDEDRPGAFAEFAASIGEVVPETFTVSTSKGAHFYFRQPAGEPHGNGRGALAGRGVDIRGKGGFIVAPPSVHQTGALYMPLDASRPVIPAPAWLVASLRAVPPGAVGRPAPLRREGSAYGRLRGVVAAVLDAKPGERNNTLFWAGCRCAEMVTAGHVDEAVVVDLLTRAGESAGLGPGEVQATIASALMRAVIA